MHYPPEFSSNVYGWDFAISIFSVALYSHRSNTVCEPFPLEFCESRGKGEIPTAAVTEVVRCLEQIPPVQLMADDKRTLVHLSDWALQVMSRFLERHPYSVQYSIQTLPIISVFFACLPLSAAPASSLDCGRQSSLSTIPAITRSRKTCHAQRR